MKRSRDPLSITDEGFIRQEDKKSEEKWGELSIRKP